MDHQSFPLWGVDVFTTQPVTGVRAIIVGDTDTITATQRARLRDALPQVPVGLVQSTAETLEIATGQSTEHPEHRLLAALSVTDTTPETVVSDIGQFQVRTIDETPGITLEPPTATLDRLDQDVDEAVAGTSRGTLSVGDAELPSAVVTLHHRWLVVPIAYFSEVSTLDTEAAIRLCEQYDAVGLCAVTFDTVDAATTVHLRRVHNTEAARPVTAAGAVGVYLRRYGAVDEPVAAVAAGLQTPPQRLYVSLDAPVAVGGPTTTFLTGEITLPADGDTSFIKA